MRSAYRKQHFQDWFTQQWAIWWGRNINPEDYSWLMGPFGDLDGIGDQFISQLAEREQLVVERNVTSRGLIASIDQLNLTDAELSALSPRVIDFYEKTALYDLHFSVKWNPFFKVFGVLVNKMFSRRINQLNIPIKNLKQAELIKSEIITLSDAVSGEVKYTIWLRTIESTGQIIYSGIYGVCTLPSGRACIKAIFPLPKGNATVIMSPAVGDNGALILDSSGRGIGDAGFYFLLNDSNGKHWTRFIRSFRDKLVVREEDGFIVAEQTLTLWGLRVLKFNYRIKSL